MPYAEIICGIYRITTPSGSAYIGSSCNIRRRWSEHARMARRGKHHSSRLQNAILKHGDRLKYEVLEICARDELSDIEQAYISKQKPVLNTSEFVKNVWANASVRKKLAVVHKSKEWKDSRSKIASTPNKHWEPVDSSDGRHFFCRWQKRRELTAQERHI